LISFYKISEGHLFSSFSPQHHKFCTSSPQFLLCHAVRQNLLFYGAAQSEVRVLLEVTLGNMVLGQLSSSQRLCADAAPFFASLSDDIET
jgi:hypothetical protein